MNKINLKLKLVLSFLVVSVISLVIGIIGYKGIIKLDSSINEIAVVRLPSIHGLSMMDNGILNIDSAENALLSQDMTPQERQQQYTRVADAWKKITEGKAIYDPLPQTPDEAKFWKEFEVIFTNWKKEHETYMQLSQEYDQAKAKNAPAVDISAIHSKMTYQALKVEPPLLDAAYKLFNQVYKINIDVAETEKNASLEKSASVQKTMIVILIVGFSVSIVLGVALGFYISNPIKRAVEQLHSNSQQTIDAASQVTSASQSLAEGASEQAASIEETSASLEELSSMTKRNAENSQTGNQKASRARQSTEKCVVDMAKLSEAMNQMSKIIKSIDEIAFQTNILALNAAVEAARAGDAGLGFAVVADEVRNLAKRSADAAKDTSEKIEQSVQLTHQVKTSLDQMEGEVKDVDRLIIEIATASKEQSQGIEQINLAVSQMDKVTQSSAANAEETASISAEMNAQANSLRTVIEDLVKLVDGSNASMETSHHSALNGFTANKLLNGKAKALLQN